MVYYVNFGTKTHLLKENNFVSIMHSKHILSSQATNEHTYRKKIKYLLDAICIY